MAYADAKSGDDKSKVEKLVLKKIEDARSRRTERAALINATYDLAAPWRRKVAATPQKAPVLSEDDIADMVDATLAETRKDFASDMIAQFTPESEPWTKMKVKETIPAELKKRVTDLTNTVRTQIFEAIEESSYYAAAPQCFEELSNGTMAARGRIPDRGGDPFEFEPIEPCDLLLCQNAARNVNDTKLTEGVMTVGDFKSLYGRYAKLPERKRHARDDEEITVIDGFYRCWEHVRGDRAWRRCVMVDDKLVYEKFYDDDPDVEIFVARWEVDGKSPWGEEIRCFRLYRPRQKRSGAGAQNLGEQIAKRPWLGQRNHVTFCHGVSFL